MQFNMEQNREVKFRGLRIDNGQWVYGWPLSTEDDDTFITQGMYHAGGTGYYVSAPHEVDPKTIGQRTGLKDKNGANIYEGDKLIVDEHYAVGGGKWTTQLTTVGFENGCFVHRSKNGFYAPLHQNISQIEIVGNIHES